VNSDKKIHYSRVLKIGLFATGISGIVAEYILSTLASYFIGNAILQFTLIVSIMLFSMGLGSRLSKSFESKIIEYFILTELILSVCVSFVAIISYLIYGFTDNSWIVIYLLSIFIGLLIGLEIPFATRINDDFESLKTNISSILEKDYYGSLIGGLFFAFIGLPYLGLTYTPFVLGILNFLVSFWFFWVLKDLIDPTWKKALKVAYVLIGLSLFLGILFAKPIILFGEQAKYKDKIVFEKQTKYQKIVITKWMNDHSLYINGNQQLSTFDEYLYHEPMVHPIMRLTKSHNDILILGGGDGCIVRELKQYPEIKNITLVDLDKEMIKLGQENKILLNLNKGALNSNKVSIQIGDAFKFLETTNKLYDIIFIDLPDPNNVDLNKLYTREFYFLCYNKLKHDGAIITQAGSPYYATKAFYSVEKTMQNSKFHTFPLHNQILTLGEWGWVIGTKEPISKQRFNSIDLQGLNLRWLNQDALKQISSFGKPLIDTSDIKVNTLISPVLYNYYSKGNWNLY